VVAEQLARRLVVVTDDNRGELFDFGEHAPLRSGGGNFAPFGADYHPNVS
jgi:hypothetical protein